MLLAFFLNAAIDQGVEKHLRETGGLERALRRAARPASVPATAASSRRATTASGSRCSASRATRSSTPRPTRAFAPRCCASVRGTVQADILKEDQAQNTCIFSTDFAPALMGDVQEWFDREPTCGTSTRSRSPATTSPKPERIRSRSSPSRSPTASPTASTTARAASRVDDFAPNFSFFFSNGLDAEYNVIGRVARRIWAVAMRERYGASERSQKLKYHVQTSGRSLHAQEMAFNDIRTTLQALTALQDHCNSLHTNAYDEAVTTPTEESVRRALAIQLIINRELGLAKNENPLQGAYVIEELTELVEEAVLRGVRAALGARAACSARWRRSTSAAGSRTRASSTRRSSTPASSRSSASTPSRIRTPRPSGAPRELMRSSEEEKRAQVANLHAFQARHAARSAAALRRLQEVARGGGNVFSELMETVKVASLGQISEALFEVGGRYRRSM